MKIEDVFSKLRPIRGRQIDLLWQEYLVAEPPLRKTIEKILRVQLAQQLGETYESEHVLLKPPPEKIAQGEYPAGEIHYGTDRRGGFALREEEFIQHIGIFGRSGSGKTNLAYMLLQGLVAAGKPFLVFDWKRNYRDILTLREFSDMLVFTVGRNISPFRFNPLIPPSGTPAKVWLKKLIEIICHAYYLGEGVAILLLRVIDRLYEEAGLYRGAPKGVPTIKDVRDRLNAYRAKGREAAWMESAIRAIETLCFGEMGNVLNEAPFVDIPKLLEKRAVLELDALTNADKTFLIESLLLWIHHYRMGQQERETFKHVIVVEEAHHILLRKKQEATGEETVTDVLLREIRELGESIICLDQHPSLISKPALGNTYTTFAFNLKHRGDLAMMQDCLLLDKEQTGYLGRLEVGWAVVKLQGRWFWPFLVKLPLIEFKKGQMTDARLRQVSREREKEFSGLLSHCGSFSSAILARNGISRPEVTQDQGILPLRNKAKRREMGDGRGKCAIELTTQERNLLRDVWQYPTSAVTERYRRLGFSSFVGNKLQVSVVKNGLVSCSSIVAPEGRIKMLSLTEEGRRAIGIQQADSDRHGGAEHRYWLKRVAQHFMARGYQVLEEMPIGGGKTIDLVAARNGKRIAVEIETGKSDASANVRKCKKAGFTDVAVVAVSNSVKERLRQTSQNRSETSLLSATELLQTVPPITAKQPKDAKTD